MSKMRRYLAKQLIPYGQNIYEMAPIDAYNIEIRVNGDCRNFPLWEIDNNAYKIYEGCCEGVVAWICAMDSQQGVVYAAFVERVRSRWDTEFHRLYIYKITIMETEIVSLNRAPGKLNLSFIHVNAKNERHEINALLAVEPCSRIFRFLT